LIELLPSQSAVVAAIAAAVAPEHQVFVFGSRSTGHARAPSDLDLLFKSPHALTVQQFGELAERFDESNLPFRVDVVDSATTSAAFMKQIEGDLKPLLSPEITPT
jgi:predicted nucleotidyltransferase